MQPVKNPFQEIVAVQFAPVERNQERASTYHSPVEASLSPERRLELPDGQVYFSLAGLEGGGMLLLGLSMVACVYSVPAFTLVGVDKVWWEGTKRAVWWRPVSDRGCSGRDDTALLASFDPGIERYRPKQNGLCRFFKLRQHLLGRSFFRWCYAMMLSECGLIRSRLSSDAINQLHH